MTDELTEKRPTVRGAWADNPDKWLSMLDAAKLISFNHDIKLWAAKDFIIDCIAHGSLVISCDQFQADEILPQRKLPPRVFHKAHLRRENATQVEIMIGVPEDEYSGPISLPSDALTEQDGWTILKSELDWVSGTIVGEQSETSNNDGGASSSAVPPKRLTAVGVKIMRDPSLFSLPEGEPHDPPAATNGSQGQPVGVPFVRNTKGGRKKSDAWNVWFAEVLVYVEENGLDANMSAVKFSETINQRIYDRDSSQEVLDFSTVEKAIREIMNRWREEKNNGNFGGSA